MAEGEVCKNDYDKPIIDKQKKDPRESGSPGGGAERKDVVGVSGVYPASGPFPSGNAEFLGQASWGQGERGAAGYEDHGESELTFQGDQVLGGYGPQDRLRQTLNVEIPADGVIVRGDLHIPEYLRGAVVFAHGSGSSRHSPRNQFVARVLQEAGIATLLLDLLTEPDEVLDRETVRLSFDIDLLANRLGHAAAWFAGQQGIEHVKLGCFGASTGAAAALKLAARTKEIATVVSRGGRPDLAGEALARVQAPVLLIVGEMDQTVLDLNREAMARLPGEKKLEIVPRATHLFEEPGTLEQAAQLARRWFEEHLAQREPTIDAA